MATRPSIKPSHGLLQPATLLCAGAIVLFEFALLFFLADWPSRIIRPETEAEDIARVEEVRAILAEEKAAETNGLSSASTAEASDTPAPLSPVADMLAQADFVPADTNFTLVELPPLSTISPAIAKAQRFLAEATAAAQFSDYASAFRILNQIHQDTPNFIPAHVEHARLLEARGNLEDARRRWSEVLLRLPKNATQRPVVERELQRLSQLQTARTSPSQTASNRSNSPGQLPRAIRLKSATIQKMPSDADVTEMRLLTAILEFTPQAAALKNAPVQIFVTFYDSDSSGNLHPTRAITTPSPIDLGSVFADRQPVTIEATYVVPRNMRAQETRDTGHAREYYGYLLQVFAGGILQDAVAKPQKLIK